MRSSASVKSLSSTVLVAAPGRQQCGLVDEVREVGADHARGGRSDPTEIDVRRKRHPARVHPQDRLSAGAVRRRHRHSPVEPAWTQQRRVEHLRSVRRPEHDHVGGRVETVHLRQDLIQRLLPLVVAAAEPADPRRARPPDRVELVDEDDRAADRLGLLEEVAHAGGADADDRFDELRRRHREERHVGLTRNRPREERLPRSRQAGEEDAARDSTAEAPVLVRVLEEVDDLRQLCLRLVDPGDVGEGDGVAGRLVAARARSAELSEDVLCVPRSSHQPDEQKHEQDRRPEAEQQTLPPRRATIEWLCVDHHGLSLEQRGELVVVRECGDLGLEPRRRLLVFELHRLA